MSYHHKAERVARTVKRINTENPHLAGDMALLAHYFLEVLPKPAPAYLAAVGTLLASPDVGTAVKKLSDNLHITHSLAETYMREGINAAPDAIKAREDELHAKGVMRGTERYFIGTRRIAPGSIYDRAWHMADAEKRVMLAEAVQESSPLKNRTLSHAQFNYVAALLIPAGNERDFALNKLSLDHKRYHAPMVEQAVEYIVVTAGRYGFTPPSDLPAKPVKPELSESSFPMAAVASAPVPPAPAQHSRLGAVLKSKAAEMSPPDIVANEPGDTESGHVLRDPAQIKKLKRDLVTLQRHDEVGKREADLYLWLHTEGINGERSVGDAAELMKESQNIVRIMVAKVGHKLEALRGADGLEGHGHQPRAVSP